MADYSINVERFRRFRSAALTLFLALAMMVIPSCAGAPTCAAGTQAYEGVCLSDMAVQYVVCTKDRGVNVTTKLDGKVSGTFKVVADAALQLGYEKSKQENTPVALQIVKDCMAIAKTASPPSDPERAQIAGFQQRADQALQDWQKNQVNETPSITRSRNSAKKGQKVIVISKKFWPNEMVDIMGHATLVAQVEADGNGSFSASVTIPQGAPPPSFDTTITAAGKSSAKSATAPFHIA
ncbi:hypothetical protein [Amycolatopsis sp. DG1A-15b]|uniref:hypothetical protein n=1 Tax=Amycolatopsis sp. DG1A-15b TaxID=3052846 RepID=UPI00255BAF1E|nr:hypothetical protein [Amycolatopsis sp. DG1A-15b]WIX90389.1 hypothetical protein QRY02_08145 [Amycolatopsis sp. DG1A-15b]